MATKGWMTTTIGSLIKDGIITGHKDGNYGSLYPRVHEFGVDGVLFLTAKLLDDIGRIDFDNAPRLADEKAEKLGFGFIESDDVLLSHNATVGRVAVVPELKERVLVGTSLTYFRVDPDRLLPRYLAAFFSGRDFQNQLKAVMSHTTRNQVPITAQRHLSVVIPPLSEQKAIAGILGTLDDKIELNRRMNETLEAMARAIFKSWFADFDPVRAKAEGRDPGLPKPIADLFPDSFEDSELGEIPRGWRVGTVDDVAIINARTLGRNESLDTIHYIEISEVMRGEVSTITRYQRGQEPSRARRRLHHGDTVLSTVRPDRGAYFLSLEPPETLIASTGFAVLTPKTGHWAFLHTLTTQQEVGDELGRLADGGAYPAVRPEVVGKLPVIVPDEANLIDTYESLTQPLFQRAAMNRRESRVLAALRDVLLPKLLSGQIRLSEGGRLCDAAL